MRSKALFVFLAFMGAVVATFNLVRLVPTNLAYEAHWGKVAFAMFLCVAGFVGLLVPGRKNQ